LTKGLAIVYSSFINQTKGTQEWATKTIALTAGLMKKIVYAYLKKVLKSLLTVASVGNISMKALAIMELSSRK
jgi:hypothetical protein